MAVDYDLIALAIFACWNWKTHTHEDPAVTKYSQCPFRGADCDTHRYLSSTELHKIPARVQYTVQCADWIDEPAPPTIP
jgi:hypothetical protein